LRRALLRVDGFLAAAGENAPATQPPVAKQPDSKSAAPASDPGEDSAAKSAYAAPLFRAVRQAEEKLPETKK